MNKNQGNNIHRNITILYVEVINRRKDPKKRQQFSPAQPESLQQSRHQPYRKVSRNNILNNNLNQGAHLLWLRNNWTQFTNNIQNNRVWPNNKRQYHNCRN